MGRARTQHDVGIYAFGWSVAVSAFNYWFDGLTAVAAIGDYCGHCSPGFECFPPLSDLHSPIKLIKNQKASTIKADKLKAKMSEMIISSAPAAFSSEYLGDELGSFSSCRSRYATMISTTPMNPARSDKWKLMEFAQQRLTS